MKYVSLTAATLAAALTVGAAASRAADLDYGRVPVDRYSAYEDPRYRDLYAAEPPRYSHAPVPLYREPPPPVPPAYVYRDAPPRHPYAEPPRHAEACLHRDEIHRRLTEEGWRDFHNAEALNGVAKVQARRPSGDLYSLKIDRCTGEIVASRLIARGGYGPYAYDDRPGRWGRSY